MALHSPAELGSAALDMVVSDLTKFILFLFLVLPDPWRRERIRREEDGFDERDGNDGDDDTKAASGVDSKERVEVGNCDAVARVVAIRRNGRRMGSLRMQILKLIGFRKRGI